MGREIRMVPAGWQHPKNDKGNYIPLLKGSFAQADADWNEGYAAWQRGEVENYGDGPKWKPKPTDTESTTYKERQSHQRLPRRKNWRDGLPIPARARSAE